jgi:FixJ family two-component response regulator
MKGLKLARLLKSQGCKPPVIMITAPLDKNLGRQAKCYGALCLLHK